MEYAEIFSQTKLVDESKPSVKESKFESIALKKK